jgi:hypothetical protein
MYRLLIPVGLSASHFFLQRPNNIIPRRFNPTLGGATEIEDKSPGSIPDSLSYHDLDSIRVFVNLNCRCVHPAEVNGSKVGVEIRRLKGLCSRLPNGHIWSVMEVRRVLSGVNSTQSMNFAIDSELICGSPNLYLFRKRRVQKLWGVLTGRQPKTLKTVESIACHVRSALLVHELAIWPYLGDERSIRCDKRKRFDEVVEDEDVFWD